MKLPGKMSAMMDVLLEDRNAVVIDDLKRLIEREPGVKSIAIIYGGYVLRSIRWAVMLRPSKKDVGWSELLSAQFIGFTGLAILGRPGEFIRPYLIARQQRLSTYSKGMLQRIGLAQALINEPQLLVLDEPTAGVDPAGSRDIRNLIVELKRRSVTVLLSSHLLTQVQEICDRVGILARGVLVREGRLEELVAIDNRSELVLENASEALVNEIEKLAANSNAKLIERRRSTTSLERLFLEATKDNDETHNQ